MILYNTSFLLFHCDEHLLMVSEQHLITALGKNYPRVHEASYLDSQPRPRPISHFYCSWTSSNVHQLFRTAWESFLFSAFQLSWLSPRVEKASFSSTRAGVPLVVVINTKKRLQIKGKGTSVAENEPNQMLMITPLAIYDNEDVNEEAPRGLCHPFGDFSWQKCGEDTDILLHFGCLISFDL